MEIATRPAKTERATVRIFFQGNFLISIVGNLGSKAIIKMANCEYFGSSFAVVLQQINRRRMQKCKGGVNDLKTACCIFNLF
jgi:hypothetical protein